MKQFPSNVVNINIGQSTVVNPAPLTADLTFTAAVIVNQPTVNANFATKLYLDTKVSAALTTINNTIPLNGSVAMTGGLTLVTTFTGDHEVVSKNYVDTKVSSTLISTTTDPVFISNGIIATGLEIPPGYIVRKPYTTTPSGYLKVNGVIVKKGDYPALYDAIGDVFNATPSTIRSAQPWNQQHSFNNTQSGDITAWGPETSLPVAVGYSSVVVTNSRVYLLGGCAITTGSTVYTAVSTVYTAPINSDGTIGAWAPDSPLLVALYGSSVVITGSRVYLLGGLTGANIPVSTVYSAPINTDGTIGAWGTGSSLPGALGYSSVIRTSTRVYLLGGRAANDNSVTSTVYSTIINTDGTLGTWGTAPSLHISVASSSIVVTSNRVYMLGGLGPSSELNTVYSAPINVDGTLGDWLVGSSIPVSMHAASVIVTRSSVYLLGGYSAGPLSTVYVAPVNTDGTIGAWVTDKSLSAVLSASAVIATSSRVYLLGGYSTQYGSVKTVLSAPFVGGVNNYSTVTGIGQPWRQQYSFNTTQSSSLTVWSAATSLLATLYFTSSVVTKNRVYLLGGETLLNTAIDTIYTAPINSDGTLGAWGTAGTLPIPIANSSVAVINSRVYLIGGGSTSVDPLDTVYTAPINTDGTLGAWGTSSSLPGCITGASVVVTNSRVYLLGGLVDIHIPVPTVYSAPINSDGTLGSWITDKSLPLALYRTSVVVTGSKVYLCGGVVYPEDNTNLIYVATINPNGILGGWTTTSTLPVPLAYSCSIVTTNRVYLFGGYISGYYPTPIVYSAPINTDDTLGAWGTETSMPGGLYCSSTIVTGSKVYVLGGSIGASTVSTVYKANFGGGLNDYSSISNSFNQTMLTTGIGQPWRQQYSFNGVQNSDITGWGTGTSLLVPLYFSSPVVTKNRVYLLGGESVINTPINTVYTAPINSDGTLGTWGTTGTLPAPLANSSVAVINSRVYLFGGSSTTTYPTSTVYSAPIDSDGVIGAWVVSGSLPGGISGASVVVTNSRVYLLGGCVVAHFTLDTVYSAPINTDGTLGTWITDVSLPIPLYRSSVIMTDSRVYLCGGVTYPEVNTGAVYYANINNDGTLGAWTIGAPLPVTLAYSFSIVTTNKAYLLGGYISGPAASSAVYVATINSDGSLGPWGTETALLGGTYCASAVVTNSKVYVLGGFNGVDTISTVYYAPFSGGLNDYTSQTPTLYFTLPDLTATDALTPGMYSYIKI